MRKLLLSLLATTGLFCSAQSFTDASSTYSVSTPRSGGPVGVVDMDGDGLDDIVLLDDGDQLYIDYQESNGTFTNYYYGQVSTSNQWGMAVGDLERDGHRDVICGASYDGVHVIAISARGVSSTSNLSNGSMFMQGCNMADINNDGWLDAFACHDDAESRIWGNDGAGSLVPQNGWIDMTTTPSSDNSGNYGSVWTDFDDDGDVDLFIAKCRQGVNTPTDPRRVNALFVNDGSGNYSEQAASKGLVLGAQSWTSDFADIDNDGDMDCLITNHDQTLQLLENDGVGNFSNITSGSGLAFSAFFLQALFEDFDNDGFVDLLIAGGSGADRLYRNNGNQTFTEVTNPFPYPDAGEVGHTFGLGDLNHDGFIDVYMGFGGGYVTPDSNDDDALFMNDGNSNHFLALELEGTTSNIDGVGAVMKAYGAWGIMTREVRAGESYGIVSAFTQTFGFGAASTIDSIEVVWPSGTIDKLINPGVDQFVRLTEGDTHELMTNVKVFLQGAYNSVNGTMHDDLRVLGLVPTLEPFTALGFTHVGGGGETIDASLLNTTGNDAIVDWVMLEVRNKSNPAQVLLTQSALVQRDGDVVDLDGNSTLVLSLPVGYYTDTYYVAVRHRNHLGCMSASALAFDISSVSMIDLTAPTMQTYGTEAQMNDNGAMVLWLGNVYVDAILKYTGANNDRDPILAAVGGSIPTATAVGYLSADANLDGIVKYTGADNDRDPILANIGGTIPTNTRIEQLP